MDDTLGRVVAVSGSQFRADIAAHRFTEAALRIGSMLKVQGAGRDVVGTISSAEIDRQGSEDHIAIVVDLLGEIFSSVDVPARFHRGISSHPIPGAPVRTVTEADLGAIYTRPSASNVSIGSLYYDARQPAFVLVDELLTKNFAVLGATGSASTHGEPRLAMRHATATASCHCAVASARKIRRVDREMRWR